MANINFGLLDTQYPEKLANALVRSPEQQNANMLQVMQMQQLMDQREQAQYALGKSRREETGLAAFGEGLRALGPDPDPDAVAQLFIKHPDRVMQQAGVEMLQKSRAEKGYGALGPMGGATVARPAAAPAPGSFGENMLANRAGLPSFGDKQLAATVEAQAAPAATQESLIAQLETRLRAIGPYVGRSPQAKAEAERITKQLENLSKPQNVAPGGVLLRPGLPNFTAPEATPQDIRTMTALGYPNTQAGYAAFRDAQRPDRLLTPAEKQQKIDIALASRPLAQPVAPTITTVEDPTRPGKFLQVDARQYLGGGAGSPGVIGGARPSATTEKIAAQRTQLGKDLGFAITQLTDITKDGGLIDQSTGSGAGRLTDIGAGFFGAATPGAIAIGKIAPIADLALKVVPRFEGPQSNADTKSYKEAAGQLADSSLPTKIRKEAGKVVLRIMQARKDQFVTNDMAAEGATSGSGVVDFGSLK